MAGIDALWRVLGMAGWDKYCYCTNCNRPYRESETRAGEFVVTGHTGSGAHAIHCVNCNDSIIRPQNPVGLYVLGFAMFCLAAFCFGFVDLRSDKIMRDLVFVCPVLGGLCIWANHQEKSKYKPIYQSWVMQHGTDPDKWPPPAKPE